MEANVDEQLTTSIPLSKVMEYFVDNMDKNVVKVESPLIKILRDFWGFSRWRLLWFFKVICSCLIAGSMGYYFVQFLRNKCKKTEKVWRLTFVLFLAPITLHLSVAILYQYGLCGHVFSDCLLFGFVAGIVLKLSSKPSGKGTVKLIVQQIDGKRNDIWLDSTDVVIGEARNMIADALNIVPANRVSIESGKGSFLDDLSKPLFSLLDDHDMTTDFFGFVTSSCYISVKEEDLRPKVSFLDADPDRDRDKKSPNPFRGLLKSEIKYGDALNLTAKVDSGAKSFNINLIDRFAAAAPTSNNVPSVQVRLLSWSTIDSNASNSDAVSEVTDNNSVASANKKRSSGGFFFSRRKQNDEVTGMTGKSVHNGDSVVIEAGGKYMSVTRGWWMAWSSAEVRRSGAFIVEVIEKAPQNKLKEFTDNIKGQIDNIKEKIGRPSMYVKDVDNILRPGDMFRLRSVKFPDYELGITSVKLKDEYCYLGLRKIDSDHDHNDEGDWCMGVRFTVRNHNITNEIFKINSSGH